MDTSKLNLASLKNKVESKLKEGSKSNDSKTHSEDQQSKKKKTKKSENNSTIEKKENTKANSKRVNRSTTERKDETNTNFKKESDKKFDATRRKRDQYPLKDVPTKSKLPEQTESPEDVLRREALALGADEDDLKLVEGVSEGEESEIEFAPSNEKLDSQFGNDLSQFMKDIGLGKGEPVVVDDEEVPELIQDDEEEEEDGSSDVSSVLSEVFEKEQEKDKKDIENSKVQERKLDLSKSKSENINNSKKEKLESVASVITEKLKIEARLDWYNIKLNTPPAEKLSPQQVARLFELGKEALEEENKTYYEEFSKSSSQRKFLSEILTSGTLNDKISALTLLIQEAPLHNMKAFENLLGMCSKKSRTAALQSINALKDLFVNGLLPDRKLVTFTKQPELSNLLNKKQLGLLYYEDFLKKSYFKFIETLEILSHDPIVHVRMNVVNHLFELLKAKPEQEVNLLKLGVNKLGDTDNKVSSKTSHQITLLEQQHPMMKKIIIDAVTDVIFKKNNDFHATYFSVLALNQTILMKREDDIANSLIKTYFTLFEKLLIETDDDNTSKLKDSDYNKTRKKRNFKKGKKGGKSVKQSQTGLEMVEETNSKLFSAILTGLNRAFPFCSLSNEVFSTHLDALFKITHSTNFNTSVQLLVLIYHIVSSQKLNTDRFYRTLYESLLDQRLLTSSKQGIYLNLLFRALKEDKDSNRVASFVKRICQICLNWLNIGTISGMLYLLINLEKSVPSLRNLIITTPSDTKDEEEEKEGDQAKIEIKQYDPRQRDPRFTNASTSSLWELNHFLNHYHPTVALYAESLLLQKQNVNKPDLGLYTLAHFLDRFVYKNAKQKATTKGSSIMQPLAGAQNGSLLLKTNVDLGEVPVNTRDWLNTKAEDINPEDLFFYKYFSTKQDKSTKSLFDRDLNKKMNDGDDDEAGSDLDDDQVWGALVKSNPEVEGDDESDFENFDNELSDLDEADFSDDDEEEGDENEILASNIDGIDEDLLSDSEDDDDDDDEIFVDAKEMRDGDEEEQEEEEEEEEEEDDDDDDDEDSEDAELFQGDEDDEFDSEELELRAIGDSSDDEEIEDDKVDSKKRKSKDLEIDSSKKTKKSKKSKLKGLPVFADANEYAKYLESDDEEF